jgi:hypothetical protein
MANLLPDRRAAGFASEQERAAVAFEARGEALDLRGFSAALRSFERDEEAA